MHCFAVFNYYTVPEETTKKSPFKSLFNRSPSKKVNPNIPKPDKKKTKNEVPPSPPKPSPAVPEKKPAPSRSPPIPKGKNAPPLTQPEHRRSMALPNLPTDKVDTKPKGYANQHCTWSFSPWSHF